MEDVYRAKGISQAPAATDIGFSRVGYNRLASFHVATKRQNRAAVVKFIGCSKSVAGR